MTSPHRPSLLSAALLSALVLGGCATTQQPAPQATATVRPTPAPNFPAAPAAQPAPRATAPAVADRAAAPAARPDPAALLGIGAGDRVADNPAPSPRAAPGLTPIDSEDLGRSTQVTEVAPPQDLWERIRRGFAMPNLTGDLVTGREQWYATRPDYIERMTERSRKYLFHVVEELERRNMPTELALLPFIESAFNPQAVSTAKAAGMWQFIPSTGKHFDLKQNIFRDDRRDVLASTHAALTYLQKLHGMFGDWHLALAAYNWGEGSVGRAIAKNQRLGLGTAYTDLSMPAETRLYVPKLQAVKNIVADPQSLNVDLPVIENHPYFQRVEIQRDIDVSLAAKLAQVPLADFKALNPSAHQPVIFAAGTPHILLPWDNAEVFRRNLNALASGQMATWTAWTVPGTMKVADAAKKVGMSETELRQVNNIPPRFLIKGGSTLLVTRGHGATGRDVTEQVADNAQLALAPEIVLRRVVVKAGKKDSLASIARRHKVTVANVADWNKLSPGAALKPGQAIALMLPSAPPRAQARAKSASSPSGGRVVRVSTQGGGAAKPAAKALARKAPARVTQKPAAPRKQATQATKTKSP